MADHKKILGGFWEVCVRVRSDYDLYRSLFETGPGDLALYASTAPMLFGELNRILIDNLILQFSKITDPARTGKKVNLTTNYILEEIPWPEPIHQQLLVINTRLLDFRKLIEPARSKRIAHIDLSAQIEQKENLGAFTKGKEVDFLLDLQTFFDVAFCPFHDEAPPSIVLPHIDTYKLVRAIEKSILLSFLHNTLSEVNFPAPGGCTWLGQAGAVL